LIGWTRQQERSRLVYIQPGHGPSAFTNPDYRLLLRRSLLWAGGRL